MEQGYRDSRGRFTAGNPGGKPNSGVGRPRTADTEKLRAALALVLDDAALKKWAAAVRQKLEAGDLDASAFVFDRILGKPRQAVDLAADDLLHQFVVRWSNADDPNPTTGSTQ